MKNLLEYVFPGIHDVFHMCLFPGCIANEGLPQCISEKFHFNLVSELQTYFVP